MRIAAGERMKAAAKSALAFARLEVQAAALGALGTVLEARETALEVLGILGLVPDLIQAARMAVRTEVETTCLFTPVYELERSLAKPKLSLCILFMHRGRSVLIRLA